MIYRRYDLRSDRFVDLTEQQIADAQRTDIHLGGSLTFRHRFSIDHSRPGLDIFQDEACNKAVELELCALRDWWKLHENDWWKSHSGTFQ